MGRWIIEHGGLPQTDPFSWTYTIYPNSCPFVVHQWLTDIIFFLLVKIFGTYSLILVTTVALCLGFIVLPLLIFRCLNLTGPQILVLLSLSLLNTGSHLQVRPEIFSYVFIALYYFILIKADQIGKLSKSSLVVLFFSMILWCNLHSGFVAGLMLLCFWLLFSFIDHIGGRKSQFDHNYLAMVPLCLIATFINPAGYKLWLYLPALFFSPISHYISEWRHIDLSFLHYGPLYPLLLLVVIFIFLSYKIFKTDKLKETGFKPFFLGLVAIIICLSISRFMNIAALTLIVAIAMLLSTYRNHLSMPIFSFTSFSLPSLMIVIATTILTTDRFIPAQIAANYEEFSGLSSTINFLKEHPQKGKLLNDAQYGDVLLWYLQPCPKIFIDSRFDLYNPAMVEKYFNLIECGPGWQNSLRAFDIDWVLFPPYFPIVNALYKDPGWKILYSDYTVLIMHKRGTTLTD